MEKKINRRMITREEAAEMLGCTPQTISNWVHKGVLTKHFINDRLYVDANTIEQYFDTYEQAAHSTESIKELADELHRRENDLSEKVRSITEDLNLWGKLFPTELNRSTLTQIIKITDGILTERETEILTYLLQAGVCSRVRPTTIAQRYGISGQTLVSDVKKAIRKLMRCPSMSSLREKNRELKAQNNLLILQNNELRENVSEYGVKHISSIVGVNTSEFETMRGLLKTRLIDCDISVRALNCLKAAEIDTIGDLVSFEKKDILRLRNMGKKSLFELERLVHSKHLEFGMNITPYHLDIKEM